MIASARGAARLPSSLLTRAAPRLSSASARISRRGRRKPLTGKFSAARCVWAPYRAASGTATGPSESRSIRAPGGEAPPGGVAGGPSVILGSFVEENVVGHVLGVGFEARPR